MRLFVSVGVPLEVAGRAAGLVPDSTALRPVHPELMHLTLAFLGWTDDARAGAAAAAVAAGAAEAPAFRVRLGPLGRFPSAGRPRVFWLGLTEGGEELNALAERVRAELRARGLQFDERPLSPHLTLARVRDDAGRDELQGAVEALDVAALPELAFEARAVDLMRSVLSRAGPRYFSEARSALRAESG